MKRLNDKVALITGAADGIGLAISQAFSREGAIVVMSDVNTEKCKQEAQKLVQKSGRAVAITCDVGISADVEKLIVNTLEKHGRIDVLVNNAAVGISGNITEMCEEDWDTLMNVNLKSFYRTVKATLPIMNEQQSGNIISISSAQASRSFDDWTAYAGAKGAIVAMTNQLAGQFGSQGVRFNTISPGAILTPMNEKRIENEGRAYLRASKGMSPMSRMGTPEEVALAAVFLASDEASFITGEDIKVDGGLCTLPRYNE